MKEPITIGSVKIEIVETRGTVVLVCSHIDGANLDTQQLQELILAATTQATRPEKAEELDERYVRQQQQDFILAATTQATRAEKAEELDERYVRFREAFRLPDDPATLDAYQNLQTPLRHTFLSLRLTSCLESKSMTTLLDPCLQNKESLLAIQNFGDASMKELELKASEVAKLKLRWQ